MPLQSRIFANQNTIREEEAMPQEATVTADAPAAPTEQALSRRALLAASAGLVGAARKAYRLDV
jgi:hypothetical protein